MKIATWNVNSIRTRLDHTVNWLTTNPVDLLCVQETKVIDQDFPHAPLTELGYHTYIYGQKSYNGVALISRCPLEEVSTGFAGVLGDRTPTELEEQKRIITGVINGVRVVNVYVPNGSEIGSDKYHYKLLWLKRLRDYLETLLQQHSDLLICGDFNIAFEDRDIHNPKGRETHIMSSDAERDALQKTIFDLGLIDIFRKFHPTVTDQFSWWDYRSFAFRRNSGWRIDHHYLSPSLGDRARSCTIDIEPRKLEKPSDHTPVIVELI
jgi:exodeoxyribonuclease III